jgi:hypothetical protein
MAFGEEENVLGGAFLFGSGVMLLLINVVSGASLLFMPFNAYRCRFAAATGMFAWIAGIGLQV